jgi:hypothetical protein
MTTVTVLGANFVVVPSFGPVVVTVTVFTALVRVGAAVLDFLVVATSVMTTVAVLGANFVVVPSFGPVVVTVTVFTELVPVGAAALAIDSLLFELNPFAKSTMNARIDKTIANDLIGPPFHSLTQGAWAIKGPLNEILDSD